MKQITCQLTVLITLFYSVVGVGCAEENRAPLLTFIPNQSVALGTSLTLTVVGSDPDGDALTFTAVDLPQGAELQRSSKSEALLSWNPLASDTEPGGKTYTLTIQVDDGRGGTATQTFSVTVFSEEGTPRFDLPTGIVVNLATGDDIAFVVGVKDDDSVSVNLAMEEGPEGALLQSAGVKSAYFYWKPTDEQRKRVVHRAVFAAQDESHGVVRHALTLVLLNAETNAGCDGTPPTIQHRPAPDTILSGAPLEVTAEVVDGESAISKVTVEWLRGTFEGTPNKLVMTAADEGYGFSAALELAGLSTPGELIHYRLVATDNDDPTGAECDRTSRSPKSGWHTVAAYADSGACLDDGSEPDGVLSTAPSMAPGAYFGRRMCGTDVDYFAVDAASSAVVVAQVIADPTHGALLVELLDASGSVVATDDSVQTTRTVTSPQGASGPFTLAVTGMDAATAMSYSVVLAANVAPCTPDTREPNDEATTATINLPDGPTTASTICAGDVDWFAFQVAPDETLSVSAVFEHVYGDLDVDLIDADGATVLATSSGENSTETVTFGPASASQTVFVRVYGHEGGANSYELVVERSEASCDEDIFAPNADWGTALFLFQGVYQNLVACPGAADWFAMEVNGGETVDVLVDSGPSSAVEVAVYNDPTQPALTTAVAGADGITYASVAAPNGGIVYYSVSATGSDAVGYDVLQQLTPPTGPCTGDRYEPNNTGADAKFLPKGVHTGLSLCGPDDEDHFLVTVPPFATLYVISGHDTEMGYTDVVVRDPNGDVVADVIDEDTGVDISVLAELAGTYRIEVVGYEVVDSLDYDFAVLVD